MGEFPSTGHPRQIWVISSARLLERMGYYGFRAVLVLFLIDLMGDSGGTRTEVYGMYAWLTTLIYLIAIGAGMLADFVFGPKLTALVGLGLEAFGAALVASAGVESPDMAEIGLYAWATGAGFSGPALTNWVNQVYMGQPKLLMAGHWIYYLAINLGAFMATLVYLGFFYTNDPAPIMIGTAVMHLLAGALLISFSGQDVIRAQSNFLRFQSWKPLAFGPELLFVGIVLLLNAFYWTGVDLNGMMSSDWVKEGLVDHGLGEGTGRWINFAITLGMMIGLASSWKRILRRPLISIGMAFLVTALSFSLVMNTSPNGMSITSMYVLTVAGEVLLLPVIMASIGWYLHPGLQGTAIGLTYGSFGLSTYLAGLLSLRWGVQEAGTSDEMISDYMINVFLCIGVALVALSLIIPRMRLRTDTPNEDDHALSEDILDDF